MGDLGMVICYEFSTGRTVFSTKSGASSSLLFYDGIETYAHEIDVFACGISPKRNIESI